MFANRFWGKKKEEKEVTQRESINQTLEKKDKEDWVHLPHSAESTDEPPVTPTTNATTDALETLRAELESETASLNSQVQEWKAIKFNLPVLGIEHQVHESRSDWIKYITRQLTGLYNEIRDAVVPPHVYIKNLKNVRVNPVIKKLQELDEQLKGQIEELNKNIETLLVPSREEKKDRVRLCDAICNTSIEILEDYEALLSNIKSEIEYALKFRSDIKSAAEEAIPFILSALIKYALGLSMDIPVPKFDEEGRFINQELFNEIHQPVEGFVNKQLLEATRDVVSAKNTVQATLKQLTVKAYPSFYTPDKNVRDAADKLETEEDKQKKRPLQRTNSSPSLRR